MRKEPLSGDRRYAPPLATRSSLTRKLHFNASHPRSYDDRVDALEALPRGHWTGLSIGQVLRDFHRLADDEQKYKELVGQAIVSSATAPDGLSDWKLWEKTADQALATQKRILATIEGQKCATNHSLFIQAVKEITAAFEGPPSQADVRMRWEQIGGIGEWTEVRKTLGFEWIPSAMDQKKFW